MRISDWSSDVCSSDLRIREPRTKPLRAGLNHALPGEVDVVGKAHERRITHQVADIAVPVRRRMVDVPPILDADKVGNLRSEERRVGKECVSTCRSRRSPYN